jgi:hypothetical protein
VHPIERLRYVARSSGAGQELLVHETASALGAFADDPQGLVTACRRIVSRQPGVGALWWLCARVLTGGDPMQEAWAAVDELDEDRTAANLAHALPDGGTVCVLGWPDLAAEALARRGDVEVLVVDALGEGSGLVRRLLSADPDTDVEDVPLSGLGAAVAASDLLLLEASVLGPSGFVAIAGSHAAAATAKHADVPVWVVAGLGRLLPTRLWDEAARRVVPDGEPWDADDEVVPIDLADQLAGPAGPQPTADALKRISCPIAPELLKEL